MRNKVTSEIARLTALVQSIPTQAREAYEQNVLGGRTLMGVVEDWTSAAMKKRLMVNISPTFLLLVIALILVFRHNIAIIPAFPFIAMLVLSAVLSVFALTSKTEARCERKMSECKWIFVELEKNLTALGLHSFEDLTEGKVRSMLQNFASLYLICETGLQLSCDNWKTIGLPNVPGVAVRYVEANDEFNTAMTTAELFGFKFTRREMVGYAQDVNESFSTC